MAELAINGGTPVAPDGLKVTWPVYDDAERKALIDVLESGRWCSMGHTEGKVAQLEKEFARFIGTRYATAVPTGTHALELAFRACELEPGEEVIVPAVTFVASASAVTLAGCVPVFVDVDPETYQISPEAVEAAVTDRTRAIEPVHYGGYPADMDRIMEIAGKHGATPTAVSAGGRGERSTGTMSPAGTSGCPSSWAASCWLSSLVWRSRPRRGTRTASTSPRSWRRSRGYRP
jgi:hypothetical protein